MEKKKLLKKLNLELPICANNQIIFLNLMRSKNYYKEFFEYSKVEKFYEFFEYSAFKEEKIFLSFINKLIKI